MGTDVADAEAVACAPSLSCSFHLLSSLSAAGSAACEGTLASLGSAHVVQRDAAMDVDPYRILVYEESNGEPGLQRGGTPLVMDALVPGARFFVDPCEQSPAPDTFIVAFG